MGGGSGHANYTCAEMPDDRVKVADVWVKPEDAMRIEAARRRKYGPFVLPSLVISITLVIVMSALIIPSVGWLPSNLAGRAVMLVVPAFIVLWVLLDYRRQSRRLRNQRLETMRHLGWRICVKCEYDLGQIGSPVCPECGTPFDQSELLDHQSRERE